MVPTPGFLLMVVALMFLIVHTVRDKWPLWPAVLCVILALFIGR